MNILLGAQETGKFRKWLCTVMDACTQRTALDNNITGRKTDDTISQLVRLTTSASIPATTSIVAETISAVALTKYARKRSSASN